MNFLPNEMLLEIFKHLNAPDLLSLSYVNQKINEIITKSELVEKFTLNFRKLNENDGESAKNRNYKRLRIGFFKPNVHTSIINEIGGNFVHLEFSFCKLKLDVIKKILMSCPNVKSLKFLKSQLSDVPNDMRGDWPVLIDLDIEFHTSDLRIFRVLTECVARKLVMDHKYLKATGIVDDLQIFLRNQENLQELSLSDFYRTHLFFNSSLDRVPFRLTTLRLRNINLARTDHFKAFMEQNHVDNLKVLEIQKFENCNFSALIAACKCLEELKIDNLHQISDIEEIPYLKKLTVFGQLPLKLNQLIHKFPSLVSVEMHYCGLSYDEEEFMKAYGRINVPHDFTALHIIDTTISKLKTKTIKILELKNVKICDDFFESNRQVEELHIENCAFNEDTLMMFLTENLENLTIINEIVTQKILDRIKDICVSLKILRLKIFKKTQIDLKLLQENRKLNIYLE
ncbi:hypothetical protein ACKWTF_015484 [Chironomus riparius]